MSLTTYCSFDEVRAALGVSPVELSNSVLALPVYEMGLVRELNRLSTSLNPAFSTVSRLLPADRTSVQQSLYEAVVLFSVYAVASQVGVSLANFAPRSVGDGKASLTRFSDNPYEDVMARIESWKEDARNGLIAAFNAFEGQDAPAQTRSPLFLASGRGTDPVTGS